MNIINEKNINYAYLKQMKMQIATPIHSREEYILWLRTWKDYHRELVNTIKFLRALKNIAKVERNSDEAIRLWNQKKYLGKVATVLYQYRIANKALVKSGTLPRETKIAA